MKDKRYRKVKIEISKKGIALIKRLHATELWGNGTWENTAERVLYRGLESIKMSDLEAWEK